MKQAWGGIASDFDVMGVRDQASADLIGPAAELHPDDIFLGGLDSLYHDSTADAPDIMISAQTDMCEHDFSTVADFVQRQLACWGVGEHNQIGVVESIPRVDRVIYDILKPHWHNIRFYPLWEILDRGFPARPGQRWISTRYHTHLMAAAAGAKGVAVTISDSYYAVKHWSVVALGSPWSVVSPEADPIPAEKLASGQASKLVENAEEYSLELRKLANTIYRQPS
jgi:hypothetical protein